MILRDALGRAVQLKFFDMHDIIDVTPEFTIFHRPSRRSDRTVDIVLRDIIRSWMHSLFVVNFL